MAQTNASRPIVHLFCNAHIDPVWMWAWEEGLIEAISTFRTAVNLLEEFPDFIFNHNESLLYEWVEEYDPNLYERIEHYVRAGRWNITGGWYLQPDVNLPGGETLVRVIQEGRRYFSEKFGVRPPIAYNFDSFGHPNSLPKLLRQSGFELYIHCRPNEAQLALPSALYRWRSEDGSEVLTYRPDTGWYGTPEPDQPLRQTKRGIEIARETGMDTLVTWGLGDHGGGPTRYDLQALEKLMAEYQDSDVEIRHSTPEAFLERVKPYYDELPVYTGELQRTLSGTYTSVATIKRQMREGEALMASAERWAATAWWRYGRTYPAESLREAWKRLMFNTFHDVLCGSLRENAIPGVDDMYGYAHDVARRVSLRSKLALLPKVAPQPDTVPLYVFNPHAIAIRQPIALNFLSGYAPPPQKKQYTLYDDDNQPVPHQDQGGDSIVIDKGTWQPFCGFVAEVPPLSVRRYEVRFEAPPAYEQRVSAHEDESTLTVESPYWTATFDKQRGALAALIDKSSGRSILRDALRLSAMEDVAHGWGGEYRVEFNRPVGVFEALSPEEVGNFAGMEGKTGPAVRVIAQGPAWIRVECLSGWQHTRAAIQYIFYAGLPFVDIHTRLHMQARRKMIKLQIPFNLQDTKVHAEVPYSVAEYPADATEYPYARWIRLHDNTLAVGVANDGQNGFDVSADGVLNLSVSRGGVHCAWEESGIPTDQSYTWMDQGQIDTRFRLVAGTDLQQVAQQLITEASILNQPPEALFSYYPPTLPDNAAVRPESLLRIEPESVVLCALKKADHEEALIIRCMETVGEAVTATLTVEGQHTHTVDFKPYQLQTFKLDRQGRWSPVNLLEETL